MVISIIKKIKNRRKYKKSVSKFLSIINNNKDYKKFIREEVDNICSLCQVEFFDVYDNKQFNKLVRKIYKLDESKFKKDINLKKRKFIDLNYIKLQYDFTSVGILAKITFLQDNFLKKMKLGYTQISNQSIIVNFKITFKKPLNSHEKIKKFINEKIELTYKCNFVPIYNFEHIIKSDNYKEIYRIKEEFIINILQAYIVNNLITTFGKNHNLPSFVYYSYQNTNYDEDTFKNVFLATTYKSKDKEFYLVDDKTNHQNGKGKQIEIYFKNVIPNINSLNYFRQYGNEFYFYLFDEIEYYKINKKMKKYFNSKYKLISIKDYKWLVNKIRSIKDNKINISIGEPNNPNFKNWISYENGKKIEKEFINYPQYINKYEKIYKEYLDYLNTFYTLQKETLITLITSLTLIATLAGIILNLLN